MDHDEHVLNLSDVVHDNITDDQDIDPSNSEPHSSQRTTSPFDSALHDAFAPSEPNPQSMSSEFSVEMLEREIASLLNQNASAASVALLNAAAQQRSAHLVLSGDGSDGDASGTTLSTMNLSLSGLAAALQAAHAHAAEAERVQDELSSKNAEYVRQRDAAIAKEQQSTRSAPAFHSLTAGEDPELTPRKRRRREGRSGSEGSDYMFTDGEDLSDLEGFESANEHALRGNHPSSRPRSVTPPQPTNPVSGEFADINDILTQLSAQFESPPDHGQGLSTSDPSPVVSRDNATETNVTQPEPTAEPPSSPPVLSPSNRVTVSQPPASTSTLPVAIDPFVGKKSPKKNSIKEKGPNQHTCQQENCQKSFTRRSDLARHMRIHTGERPFVCEYNGCGKTFIQRSALHVHSRVHTGEKPHCCEYPGCGKTFGDSSSLARHRRTHTGKRPYKCEDPSCEKTFTRRTTLTTHMKTHDPTWEPDPAVKYNFKGKKRKVSEEEDARELAEHVQTISALFQAENPTDITTNMDSLRDDPFQARVASISAEIAAAIAQAQSRVYQEPDEDEHSGSGQELDGPETITPNTSGIRGLDDGDVRTGPKDGRRLSILEEDDDSDAFPIPLRSRKAKESPLSGHKRKR